MSDLDQISKELTEEVINVWTETHGTLYCFFVFLDGICKRNFSDIKEEFKRQCLNATVSCKKFSNTLSGKWAPISRIFAGFSDLGIDGTLNVLNYLHAEIKSLSTGIDSISEGGNVDDFLNEIEIFKPKIHRVVNDFNSFVMQKKKPTQLSGMNIDSDSRSGKSDMHRILILMERLIEKIRY